MPLVPAALLDPSCVWNPDKDASAMQALAKVPYGGREFAGALYQNDKGEYCYSAPIPGTGDNFKFTLDHSPNVKFAGLWHSHPKGPDSEKFGADDLRTADQLKIASYLRNNADGWVARYDPGVSPVITIPKAGTREREKASLGTPVGKLSRKEQLEAAYALHEETKPQR